MAMDPVNKKAVKKDFEDRKDQDIDNDGDVDSSDEYLHKRRKAVSKAVKNVKESVELNEKKMFKTQKVFNSEKEANDFLEKNDDYGVTHEKGGKVYVAKKTDMGESVELDEAADSKDFFKVAKNLKSLSDNLRNISGAARFQKNITGDTVNELRDDIQVAYNELGYMIQTLKKIRLNDD